MKALKAWFNSRSSATRPSLALASSYFAGKPLAHGEVLQVGLELATQGIVLLDEGWRITSINTCARELLHCARDKLSGVDFWEVVPEEIADEHRSAAELALQSGGAHTFVGHHAFESQWVEYSLRRHAQGLVVNLRDLSAERRAALLLADSEYCNETLFDASSQVMWLLDAESRRIIAANKAAAGFYGIEQDQLAGLAVETLFPEGEGAALLASLPASSFVQEMRLCTQKKLDGERVLVELSCGSVQWFERPAVLVSVADVGARHLADAHLRRLNTELERRLESSTAELQRSHHELEAFTYAMSNDLKAPLHVVNGFARTLAERHASSLDEQGRHFLGRIQASTQQLAKLIDDLRTLTHLPRLPLIPETVDMAPLCKRLIDNLRKRDPLRQVVLEIPETLPLVGDRTMLIAALESLIDNAWKFTSRKEQGWIKVGLAPGKLPGHTVFFVTDNGAGFDPAYVEKLFTAFQRLHSSADFPGGGLGLAIVRRVAERHGGEVWATTVHNAGASFFLSLPQGEATPQGPSSRA